MSVWSIWDQQVSRDYLESVVGKYLIAEVTHRNLHGEVVKRSRIDGRIARICDARGVVIKTSTGEAELCVLDTAPVEETQATTERQAQRAYQQALHIYQSEHSSLAMQQAFEQCHLAAMLGYQHAQYLLGVFYARGFGVNRDYIAAADWFQKAAQQGHSRAQYNLGDLYSKGVGVQRSRRRAVWWYCQAARQGLVKAEQTLLKHYAVAPGSYEATQNRLNLGQEYETDDRVHSSEWYFYVPHNTTDHDYSGKMICLSGRLLRQKATGAFRRVN